MSGLNKLGKGGGELKVSHIKKVTNVLQFPIYCVSLLINHIY